MGSSQAETGAGDERELGRRSFLFKAAVTGSVAFAIPTIVSVSPAGASTLVSPPPKPPDPPTQPVDPGQPGTPQPTPEVRAETVVAPDPGGNAASGTEVAGAQLPFTGADVKDLVVGGLAATAGGAALMLWSADPAQAARAAAQRAGVTPPEPPAT